MSGIDLPMSSRSVIRAPKHLEQQVLEIPGVAVRRDTDRQTGASRHRGISAAGHRSRHFRCLTTRNNDSIGSTFAWAAFRSRARNPKSRSTKPSRRHTEFTIGSTFKAILNGKKRELTIVGIALSPEFIYALGPGDLMPDDRRFAVLWMSEKALAAIFDLDGAFNAISLKLLTELPRTRSSSAWTTCTRRYGGMGAIGRADQLSHAFLDAELKQLEAMAQVIPPIFLFVSAFLINMTLSRLIALEREQIGLLKAIGYGRSAIAGHYIKMVLGHRHRRDTHRLWPWARASAMA